MVARDARIVASIALFILVAAMLHPALGGPACSLSAATTACFDCPDEGAGAWQDGSSEASDVHERWFEPPLRLISENPATRCSAPQPGSSPVVDHPPAA